MSEVDCPQIVVLQKQLRDAEKETWRTALDGQSAQQSVFLRLPLSALSL